MRLSKALLIVASAPLALTAPVISVPAANAQIKGGTAVTITWADDGAAPLTAALTTCVVQLFAGSNTVSAAIYTAPGAAVAASALTTSVLVPVAISGSAQNAYFWALNCAATAGGQYQVFSPHFTLTGMTGVFPATITTAVAAITDITAKPPVNNVAKAPNAAAPGAADPAQFTVPYNLQEGTVRYAPMQPIPPTAITATNTAPLYPTSAVTFAKTLLPIPTIVTTYTQPGTFTVASHPNTAAAASSPVNDMQRFLNRWKD